MTTPIDLGVDLVSSAGWGRLLSCSEDSDAAVACSAFASFLASRGFKISKIDQVPPAPPPSTELISSGALAIKRVTEVRKRPLASIEDLDEEIGVCDELEAAKVGSKRQKSKDSSLVLLEGILTAFKAGEALDQLDIPSGSGMEKAAVQCAKRALSVNKLPENIVFTGSPLGDEGWLSKAGVPHNKRKYFAATLARLSLAVKDRLHTFGIPGACQELKLSWREAEKVHNTTVWAWTGDAIETRRQLCSELTSAQVSQIRYCKACAKLSWTFCGCTLPMP